MDPEEAIDMADTNRCAECGGTLQEKIVTYTHPWGQKLYRFENVSALVCVQCGHVWLSAETSRLIDEAIRKPAIPKKYEQVPVFSLPELAGR